MQTGKVPFAEINLGGFPVYRAQFPVRAMVISWVRSFRERKVKEYRVTKYNPKLRGPNDEYHRDEWISFTQIGQSFGGVVLTEEEYKRIERAYIKAALAFLGESGITALRVEGLENSRQQPLKFHEGDSLSLEQLPDVMERILREEAWCRLQASEAFVHFGWDYYMYIGVPHRCVTAEQAAIKLGLYVEEFASPYHEKAGN